MTKTKQTKEERNEAMKRYRAKSGAKRYIQTMATLDDIQKIEEWIDSRVAEILNQTQEGDNDEKQ